MKSAKLGAWISGVFVLSHSANAAMSAAQAAQKAQQIFSATGVTQGVCAYLLPDASLSQALGKGQNLLIHGLAKNESSNESFRAAIRPTGDYGLISSEVPLQWNKLPYSDETVNLIVTENLKDLLNKGTSLKELWRVLAPKGALYLSHSAKATKNAQASTVSLEDIKQELAAAGIPAQIQNQGNGFVILAKKAIPDDVDGWTHWDYGPEGNSVSRDQKVEPPTHVKWISGNESEGAMSGSQPGMRLSDGKVAYHFLTYSRVPADQPRVYEFTVRDAFNGSLLWKKENLVNTSSWSPLIFDNNTIYVFSQQKPKPKKLPDPKGPVLALDANNGDIKIEYNIPDFHTEFPGRPMQEAEMRLAGDVLVVSMYNRIWGLNAKKNEVLWTYKVPNDHNAHFTVASEESGHVYSVISKDHAADQSPRWKGVLTHEEFIALDLKTGKQVWSVKDFGTKAGYNHGISQIAYYKGYLGFMCNSGRSLTLGNAKGKPSNWSPIAGMIDAKKGKAMWFHKPWMEDKGPAGWIYTFAMRDNKAYLDVKGNGFVIYDIFNGEWEYWRKDADLVSSWNGGSSRNPAQNQRCGRMAATDRYWMSGYVTWIDKDFNYDFKPIRRSGCATHLFPGYGMTYYTPAGCKCYKMLNNQRGYVALGNNSGKQTVVKDGWRLVKNDPKFFSKNGGPTKAISTSILRKKGAQLGPIMQDWPENRSGKNILAKSSASPSYHNNGYRFQSLGSALHVQISKGSEFIGNVTLGGRMATAPAVIGDIAIFGAKDGWVYGYDLKSKNLAWRFLAAPSDERILVSSQFESMWPVTALKPEGDRIFVTAGRHGSLGDGIFEYQINGQTGKLIEKKRVYMNDSYSLTRESIALNEVPDFAKAASEDLSQESISKNSLTAHSESEDYKMYTATGQLKGEFKGKQKGKYIKQDGFMNQTSSKKAMTQFDLKSMGIRFVK